MNRIAELRKKHGFSQIELADRLGIAQNTLSQYEHEVRQPTPRVISELVEIFDITENYLLGFPEPPAQPETKAPTNDIINVTKVVQLSSAEKANLYLNLGWRLLHVGEDSENHSDGSGYSTIVYTLGWFGDPNLTISQSVPDDGDEYEGTWHQVL